MRFKYPNQFDDEPVDIDNKVLPILDDEELKDIGKAITCLAENSLDETLEYLKGMLMDLGCTCEKDSFCDFVANIIKVMYYFDSRKDKMLEDLEYVIYQMF